MPRSHEADRVFGTHKLNTRTRWRPIYTVEVVFDPIDDRDRVESRSPLPRHFAVAIP
jgi:hypothetical protein